MKSSGFVPARRLLWQSACLTLGSAGLGLSSGTAALAQSWPEKPVRLILGFAAGGSGDALARTLAPEVGRILGQPLVIENRPGAGTNLASDFVAKAPADGYTLLLGGSFSHAVNPALFAKLPFDAERDFTPIIRLTSPQSGGQVFVVPATFPANTLNEFIERVRREPGKFSYASSGIGSPGHIAGAYFVRRLGLDMVHVPYKGASEAVRDLIAGQIQLTITAPTAVLPLMRQGRLKALSMTVPARSKFLPDVPSSAEAGLGDFDLDGRYGIFAPAGLAPGIVERINLAFREATATPAVTERLDGVGLSAGVTQTPQEFTQFVRQSAQRWARIVKDSGASVQ